MEHRCVRAHTRHTHVHTSTHTCTHMQHVHARTHATHIHQPGSGSPSRPPQSPTVRTETPRGQAPGRNHRTKGQQAQAPGGSEGQRQSRAGAPSLSASTGPVGASGPGRVPSVLPSALPLSPPLCCFCRRVSLYRRVMSLGAAGRVTPSRPARPEQNHAGPRRLSDPPRDTVWPLLWGPGAHRRKKRQTVQVNTSTEPSVQHWAM